MIGGPKLHLEKRKASLQSDLHEQSPQNYPWWSKVYIKLKSQVLKGPLFQIWLRSHG
ncbi:unnamed protein product [Penicillium camemberti]|uniref:Str. FM013 n=1 Tax=Penicillium camemberti (strain FM 013) TaxID=1429867 RepID=A0A0G4PK70_PENC3|nr:unnamed protein product [Penicillium camemberti]